MHAVFAIEPKAINSWHNFRYLIEKFGFPNGVLIARYPKSWRRLVIDACDANNVRDVERLKIVEKLGQIKDDRMLNKSFPFIGGSWLENALKPEVADLFDVLVLSNDSQIAHSYSIDDIPEDVFHNRREMQVLRNAKSLAAAACSLFVHTKEVTLIDPYLKPKRSCTNLLNAFVDLSLEKGCEISRFVIHMAYSQDPRERDEVIAEYKKYLGAKIANGLTIQVNRWDDANLDFDFHARYLLTERAGLRYDRGFIEPADHDVREHKTDVACLEGATVKNLLNQYKVIEETKLIFDVIEVQ